MALLNATLNLKLDRTRGTFEVQSTSTRVYSQDENVALNTYGWTLDEVTKTSGKTPYEPYFRIVNADGTVLAECKLSPDETPTPETDGTYAMRGTLSTNTDKMVAAFEGGGYQSGWQYDFDGLIYATTEANPISKGVVYVWAFDSQSGIAPSNLPTASEVLASLTTTINNHVANVSNPHSVTAAQIGAYTKAQTDAAFCSSATAASLQEAISAANSAIAALQSAVQTANLAIQANTLALNGKANVVNTYRKDETYSMAQVDVIVASGSASRLLGGKTFATPTNDKGRNALLVYLVRALGGDISGEGITPGTTTQVVNIVASDGTTRGIRVVKLGDEYTTEVT